MTSGTGYAPQPLPLWSVEDVPPSATRKRNPLLEVLGRACDDPSQAASDIWDGYIMSPTTMVCPFKWSRQGDTAELFCHKSKAERPLSVCAVSADDSQVVTCPYRFEEGGLIFDHAWRFLVGTAPDPKLVRQVDAEIRLSTTERGRIGNADFIVSALDPDTNARSLCSVEVQAAYNSGNTSDAFEKFISGASLKRHELDWSADKLPRPDFLSSWKRLRSQLLDKGPDLAKAEIKQVVVVDTWFLSNMHARLCTQPGWAELEVPEHEADVAIFGYDLVKGGTGVFQLTRKTEIYTTYTRLRPALERGGELDLAALNQTLDDRLAKRQAALAAANAQLLSDSDANGGG